MPCFWVFRLPHSKDWLMRTLLLFLLVLTTIQVSAQNLETDTIIYDIVEKTAVPENGYPHFYDGLKKNTRFIKTDLYYNNLKFYIEFIIDIEGNCKLEIVKPDKVWDVEFLKKYIENTKWTPAEHKGRKVRQRMIMPMHVRFG